MLIIYFISSISRTTISTGYSATVEVLHRTTKWGEVRRLACPLRRFPFAAPPNCGEVPRSGQGGKPLHERSEAGLFSSPAGRLYGFVQTGAFYNLEAPPQPSRRRRVKPKNPRGDSPVSRVDGIRLLCPPLTEPYVRFSRIRLLE